MITARQYLQHILVLLAVAGLCACATVQGPQPDDPFYAPTLPPPPRADFENPGGVAHARFGTSLFSDRKARHVGDILTVILDESTSSSKSAETDITKDNEIDFNQGVVLGETVGNSSWDLSTDIEQERDFESEAESEQSNSLRGNITVTITDVLPNGLLVVRGEKWLRLNQGDEYIRLTGMVREEDIGADNSISSTKVADARISYSGTGAFAKSNEPGWGSKIFNSPWWPF